MTINLTIISLFHSKYEVNPSSLKFFILNTEVPSTNLEQMKYILWYILNIFIHDVLHGLHLPIIVSILFHESFFLQNIDIKELVLGGKLLEGV